MALDLQQLTTLAAQLRAAEGSASPIAPLRTQITSAEEAYAIQEINTNHRLEQGARLVGRKIGLTNPAVQKQLGVDQPDYGMLFADMDIPHGGEIPWAAGAQYKVEAELAFVLGRALPQRDCTMAEVMAAIDFVSPSLEIVGSRIENWDIRFVDTVADNASSAFFTLGPVARKLDQVDLLDCKMVMTDETGEIRSQGLGRACLGSPLNAVLWLARRMAELGRPLQAGDVVLSGALGPMVTVTPGGRYTAKIEGFGETSIAFGL